MVISLQAVGPALGMAPARGGYGFAPDTSRTPAPRGMEVARQETVGESLAKRLSAWGVDTVFGHPGDGINGLMEGFHLPTAASPAHRGRPFCGSVPQPAIVPPG